MLRELAPTSRLCRRSWRNRWFRPNSEKSVATKSPYRALIRAEGTRGTPGITEIDVLVAPTQVGGGFKLI